MNPRVKAKVAMVSAGSQTRDTMISYEQEDKAIVLKIQDKLRDVNLHPWMEMEEIVSGADIFTKIGQAVVDSRTFMFVMSSHSVKSKICQDQLALAYVSNKPIIPVALEPNKELLSLMETGMKLELAGFEWFSVAEESFDEDCKNMVNSVKKIVDKVIEKENLSDVDTAKKTPMKTRRALNRTMSRSFNANEAKLYLEDGSAYWSNAFHTANKVSWTKFRDRLLSDFRQDFDTTFGQEDTEWLLAILRRELDITSDEFVLKENYINFCTIDDMIRPLWTRIQDQARESYAMKEVFEIDSSVRVQAIENLGKFKSATVIDALCDLLADKDANVQAVAIISLARTGANDDKTIRQIHRCLRAKDRVVREAACLALGTLKAEQGIDQLVELWRNDIISNVREAALAALKKIGGQKAEEAIRVTVVLENEIRSLKTS